MDQVLLTVREQQKEVWNKFSGGWRKWDELTMRFLEPMGDMILGELKLRPDDVVLDIASGTGEPALTIAGLVPDGKVIATDLSEEMLAIAEEKAKDRGLDNFKTTIADCCELHYSDGSFDKLSCRMGFMFFPDMPLGAEEMNRVLKDGGIMATSVWGPSKDNPWASIIMEVIKENINVEPPLPGSPGLFRCAETGLMESILKLASFRNIKEIPVKGKAHFGTFDTYWNMMTEVAAPVVSAMKNADAATTEKIKQQVKERCLKVADENDFQLGYLSYVYSAEK